MSSTSLNPLGTVLIFHFQSFANFYQRFFCNFSLIAAPLTSILKKGPINKNELQLHIKPSLTSRRHFPSLNTQTPPDNSSWRLKPPKQKLGLCCLSNLETNPNLFLPFAFFSQKLLSTFRNYNIGNQELLAVNQALEEWHCRLVGLNIHLLSIKDLEDTKTAQYLNSCQARWTLFVSHLSFSYRVQEHQAESLSCLYPEHQNMQ